MLQLVPSNTPEEVTDMAENHPHHDAILDALPSATANLALGDPTFVPPNTPEGRYHGALDDLPSVHGMPHLSQSSLDDFPVRVEVHRVKNTAMNKNDDRVEMRLIRTNIVGGGGYHLNNQHQENTTVAGAQEGTQATGSPQSGYVNQSANQATTAPQLNSSQEHPGPTHRPDTFRAVAVNRVLSQALALEASSSTGSGWLALLSSAGEQAPATRLAGDLIVSRLNLENAVKDLVRVMAKMWEDPEMLASEIREMQAFVAHVSEAAMADAPKADGVGDSVSTAG